MASRFRRVSGFADDASLRSLISFESGSYLTWPGTWHSL